MPKIITEDMIEQAAIKALQERHDCNVLNCMTEEPDTLPDGTGRKDKKQVVLPDVMLESLCRINPDIPEQTVRTVVDELCHTPVSGDLMLTNYQNYQKIRNGITVEYNENGKKTSNILRLLSYNDVLSNDDVKNEFSVLANTVDGLYESLRPDIFKMDFEPAYKDAILYLKGIIDGKIRPEKIEAAQARINELLDQSVITAADARKYTIAEAGKELDLSKLDIDELRSQFKKLKNKNLEIANLRKYIEEKLQKMLRRNITRTKFAERFRNIINEYNAGGSQNDDFYEKLLKLMEELRAEEERHIKEELSETELELFDLLRKEQLTVDEEKRVKLTAKELYNTLTEKRNELFIVGWQNDPQPKERVKGEIVYILNKFLPESYDREVFLRKSTLVFDHIVDQAMTGYNWVA